ncbi:dihydrofolate reductase [Ceratobasidium sp. 414]|nr:dihydrofolate reductase [Ceratobasidium sp. 414]
MTSNMPPPQLTLVAAATLTNGLGVRGGLPWRLSREMAYFARVTRSTGIPSPNPSGSINAVIMGRKSWESIPLKFRPLKDRLNVVISSQAELKLVALGLRKTSCIESFDRDEPAPEEKNTPLPILAPSLDVALSKLDHFPIRNIFIIGGASIYTQALQHSNATRILLTRVLEPAYDECDVFFPEVREGGDWTKASHAQLAEWVGFDVAEGVQEEKGTKYEFQMWVKKGSEGSVV